MHYFGVLDYLYKGLWQRLCVFSGGTTILNCIYVGTTLALFGDMVSIMQSNRSSHGRDCCFKRKSRRGENGKYFHHNLSVKLSKFCGKIFTENCKRKRQFPAQLHVQPQLLWPLIKSFETGYLKHSDNGYLRNKLLPDIFDIKPSYNTFAPLSKWQTHQKHRIQFYFL